MPAPTSPKGSIGKFFKDYFSKPKLEPILDFGSPHSGSPLKGSKSTQRLIQSREARDLTKKFTVTDSNASMNSGKGSGEDAVDDIMLEGKKQNSEYNLVYTNNLQNFGESASDRYKSSNSQNSFEKDQPYVAMV